MILENDSLKIRINEKGAELKSVFNKKINKEILYEGNSPFWNRSAPVLFPIVGRLKNDSYQIKSKMYELTQHGFARNEFFSLVESSEIHAVFSLKSSSKTQEMYPFSFELLLSYLLDNNKVTIIYQVKNLGSIKLPFSIGGHPGFICPIHKDEVFEDYYLEFQENENLLRYLLNCETGLFTGEVEKINIEGKILNLSYDYFLKDALVFKGLKSKWVKLKSKKSAYCLTFRFENFPYFGIWTKENASFICLEPWCGLADSEYSTGKFLEKEGIELVEPNEFFERTYSFSV